MEPKKRIVCLGWGSLVWKSEQLPVKPPWNGNGPELPVEFARQSRDGRLTLVIVKGKTRVPVLWAELSARTLDEAREALRKREGIPRANLEQDVGYWTPDTTNRYAETEAIGAWAASKKIDAVIWTALPPKFGDEARSPTLSEALSYLKALSETANIDARNYVVQAPGQIRTPYRVEFEKELGWKPES